MVLEHMRVLRILWTMIVYVAYFGVPSEAIWKRKETQEILTETLVLEGVQTEMGGVRL